MAKTKSIPNTLFAVHPRVPQEVFDKLLQQVLSWPMTEEGRVLLKGTKVEQFITTDDKDYDVVREMAKKFR